MENVVNRNGLSLAYINDPEVIDCLDQEAIFEDLAEGTSNALVFRPERWRLADHDHVVLVRGRRSGRYLGLLAASVEQCGDTAFLNIDTCFIVPAAQDLDLFQRMLAVVVLRMEGLDAAPSVVSTCTDNPDCLAALRGLAARFPGAVLFPELQSTVVRLETAALARRIARRIAPRSELNLAAGSLLGTRRQVLAVLDLRASPPAGVVEAARSTFRMRPGRAARRAAFGELPAARRVAKG